MAAHFRKIIEKVDKEDHRLLREYRKEKKKKIRNLQKT